MCLKFGVLAKSRGFESVSFEGVGSMEDPIKVKIDVSISELLQLTWQAILNFYGYKGLLELATYEKNK